VNFLTFLLSTKDYFNGYKYDFILNNP